MPTAPTEGTMITREQINAISNYNGRDILMSDKGWHIGQLEGWAMARGIPNGMPLYAGVTVNFATKAHVYWLPDVQEFVMCLLGETPPAKTKN